MKYRDPTQRPLTYWHKRAVHGDAEAQFRLGWMYSQGVGLAVDEKQSCHWYQEAANQGYAPAANNLGVFYQNKELWEQSFFWYGRAVELKHAQAAYNLGKLYERGVDSAPNYEEAVKLYEQARGWGEVSACVSLAYCYAKGLGVVKSLEEAERLWTEAAEAGILIAIRNLSLLYLGLIPEFQSNLDAAYYWLIQGGDQGCDWCQSKLRVLESHLATSLDLDGSETKNMSGEQTA